MPARTASVNSKRKPAFDIEEYLKADGPRQTVTRYRRGQVIFAQGDAGHDVRYLQKGAIKLSVLSRIGKEAVVAMLVRATSSARACWRGNRFASAPRPRSRPGAC